MESASSAFFVSLSYQGKKKRKKKEKEEKKGRRSFEKF